MNIKKILIYIIAIIIVAIVIWFFVACQTHAPQTEITSFDECVAAGNSVMESYPERCATKDGKTFTQDIGNELEKADLIKVSNPRPNTLIASPLIISGEARGNWFFEASFPIHLIDKDGNVLATTTATAKADWMTEDFVPFEATIDFINSGAEKATLILLKDNPSDLPENDDMLTIPVKL